MQFKFETPSIWHRMACWLYEGVLLFGVVFIAGYVFSSLSQTRNAMDNRHAMQLFVFIIIGIYFVWFWSKGQTLAMKTWNIRLVDRHGCAVSQARAFARYCFSWLWFLPPLVVLSIFKLKLLELAILEMLWIAIWTISSQWRTDQQFWHDILAGTRLVKSQALSRENLPYERTA